MTPPMHPRTSLCDAAVDMLAVLQGLVPMYSVNHPLNHDCLWCDARAAIAKAASPQARRARAGGEI